MRCRSTHVETLTIHAGKAPNDAGALATPIYQTSTFVFDDAAQGAARFAGEAEGYIYSRLGNPTNAELERKMAALEGTEAAATTGSGMGAVSAAIMANVKAGDHIISSKTVYGCTFALLSHLLTSYGVEVSFVDMTREGEMEAALKPNTRLVFAETPVNPNLDVIDLQYIADFARANKLISVVDNTFMTPVLQQPAKMGIDIVIHSATKYLNGHGDVVAGIICADAGMIEKIKLTTIKDMGAIMSPHDAWLILRGMKTLALRVERHCQNAQQIAEYLDQHPLVNKVYYPGLPSHPGHRFIGHQMKAAGGCLAFEIKGKLEDGIHFINSLSLCTLAVSLGDAETLIQHPASMTHSPYTAEERQAAGISDGLIRLAVGLEHVDDIIADLEQGFAAMQGCAQGQRRA